MKIRSHVSFSYEVIVQINVHCMSKIGLHPSPFTESECSLSCPLGPATRPCTVPVEYNLHPTHHFFNIILSFRLAPRFPKWSHSLKFYRIKFCMNFSCRACVLNAPLGCRKRIRVKYDPAVVPYSSLCGWSVGLFRFYCPTRVRPKTLPMTVTSCLL